MKHLIGYLGLALCAAALAAARPAPASETTSRPQVAQADTGVDRTAGTHSVQQTRGAADDGSCDTLSVAASTNPFAGNSTSNCSNPYLRNANTVGGDGPYHTWSGY